jgi:hypothetical protein
VSGDGHGPRQIGAMENDAGIHGRRAQGTPRGAGMQADPGRR